MSERPPHVGTQQQAARLMAQMNILLDRIAEQVQEIDRVTHAG